MDILDMENNAMFDRAFELIAYAGNSKSTAMMAIEAARDGDFPLADQYVAESERDYLAAHEIQSELLKDEMNGAPTELSLLMVHAQDHLTMATMGQEFALEFVRIYKLLADKK